MGAGGHNNPGVHVEQLGQTDRETQDRYIIQMYKATVCAGHKRKILTALADLDDTKWQRTEIQAFCKEMIKPNGLVQADLEEHMVVLPELSCKAVVGLIEQ